MNIMPYCKVKTLSECEPGTIVRSIDYHWAGEFALVATVNEGENRALVILAEGAPEFFIRDDLGQWKFLAYESKWILNVDQCGPFEGSPRDLYNAPGCLICKNDRWLLNVREWNAQFHAHRAQYDLGTFRLLEVSHELNNIATFGKWSLHLGTSKTPQEDRIKIAEFEWKSLHSGAT